MRNIYSKYKKIIIVSGIILAIGIVTMFIIAGKYGRKIKQELPGRFAQATDSLYNISVNGVGVNILTRSVTLRNVHISVNEDKMYQQKRDSCAKKHYYDITVPRLRISGIMWDRLVGGQGLSCSMIKIIKPVIKVYKTTPDLCVYDTIKNSKKPTDLYAGKIKLTNGDISYILSNRQQQFRFEHSEIVLNKWSNKTNQDSTASKFLMSENGVITVGNFSYINPQADYHFTMHKLAYNSTAHKLTARDLQLKLKMSEADFLAKHGIQKEVYDLSFPTLELTKIDWKQLTTEGSLIASTLYLNNFNIGVRFNRTAPENPISKLGKYPNQLLQKLTLPVYIKEVKMNNGGVSYTEVSDKTKKEATITAEALNGNISNITNIPVKVEANNISKCLLTAKLNKYSDVQAKLNFVLDNKKGAFTLDLNIDGLQSRQISEQTKALSMIAIKSFNMKNLNMKLDGDERSASGLFIMQYSNLAIKIIKTEDDLKKTKRKKGLMTFITNNLILYSSNPMPGESIRKVHTNVKRDETKSFFNLIWKNIHAGVQETTIRDRDIIDWIRREQAKSRQTGSNKNERGRRKK